MDYWSNRINAWEDFPDVRGTINGSLGAVGEAYGRSGDCRRGFRGKRKSLEGYSLEGQ